MRSRVVFRESRLGFLRHNMTDWREVASRLTLERRLLQIDGRGDEGLFVLPDAQGRADSNCP